MSAVHMIYVAGPKVFAPNAMAFYAELRARVETMSLRLLTPVDNEPPASLGHRQKAAWIRNSNIALLNQCTAVVADVSPFRGPGMDDGTAFEIGFAIAQQKTVRIWTDHPSAYPPGWPPDAGPMKDYAARVISEPADVVCRDGGIHDGDGWLIENFGLYVNLMIAAGQDEHPYPTPESAIHAVIARLSRSGATQQAA